MKEVLRLDPSGPSLFPRVAPKGGLNLNGLYIPEGTAVSAVSWVINRNKEVYGEDAEEFRPERWMKSEERARELDNYSFTFGYGARVCLGKNLGLMELNKAVVQVRIGG